MRKITPFSKEDAKKEKYSPENRSCRNCDKQDQSCIDVISMKKLRSKVYKTHQGNCYNVDTINNIMSLPPDQRRDPLTRDPLVLNDFSIERILNESRNGRHEEAIREFYKTVENADDFDPHGILALLKEGMINESIIFLEKTMQFVNVFNFEVFKTLKNTFEPYKQSLLKLGEEFVFGENFDIRLQKFIWKDLKHALKMSRLADDLFYKMLPHAETKHSVFVQELQSMKMHEKASELFLAILNNINNDEDEDEDQVGDIPVGS